MPASSPDSLFSVSRLLVGCVVLVAIVSLTVASAASGVVALPGIASLSAPSSPASERPAPERTASTSPTVESSPTLTSTSASRSAPTRSATPLSRRIDDLVSRGGQAFWGLSVVDLETGETLYAQNPDMAFLPASNQKLLTTATALDALGSTYRYETTLRFDGTTEGAVMRGDFILDGSGDPTFGSVELRGVDPLQQWAERLAAMGVERVEGRLVGDDNRFDDRPYPEGWDIDYITEQAGRYMGTSASGLSYKDNVVAVQVHASRPGVAPSVTVRPSGAVQIRNDAVTSSRWRGSSLQVDRTFDTNRLTLHGSVPRTYRGTVNVPVSNPTTFALQSFVEQLQDVGIETDLTVVDVDELDRRVDKGEPLFVHLSPPLSEIVAVINKRSNNFYAEQVFRTFGWGGSATGASKRARSFLRRTGVDARDVLVHDGSGLSRKNLVSPRSMTTLLRHMDRHEARSAFLASLPQGGENNTTLEYRMHRTPVQAKTGSLRFVRALSGYAQRPDGSRVAFALFANNYTGPSYQISRTMDDVVRAVTSAQPQ